MRLNWQRNCNASPHGNSEEQRDEESHTRKQGVRSFAGLKMTVMTVVLFIPLGLHAQSAVLDLNAQIQEKKRAQQELQQQMNEYSSKIRATQKKAASLANQISILESNIRRAELEIRTKELETQQLALEVELVERQITDEGKR